MKKVISLVLVLMMAFSMISTAMAATVIPTVSADKVAPDSEVILTLTLDEALEKIINFCTRVYFDADKYELVSSANGVAHEKMQISNLKTDKNGLYCYDVSYVDTETVGQTINAGVVYTLTFKAKQTVSETAVSEFKAVSMEIMNVDFEDVVLTQQDPVSVTINATPACDHQNTEKNYAHVEGTQTHKVTCTCGAVVAEAEPCVDSENDGNLTCDNCGYNVGCAHENKTPFEHAQVEGTETHKTTTTCDNADCDWLETSEAEDCTDDDSNGKCDVCGGEVEGDTPDEPTDTINVMHADLSVDADKVKVGDTVSFVISIENDADAADAADEYASYKFMVDYDAAKLTYVDDATCAESITGVESFDVRANGEGKLIIDGFGEMKTVAEEASRFIVLNFKAEAEAEAANVKITKAYASTASEAITKNIDALVIEIEDKKSDDENGVNVEIYEEVEITFTEDENATIKVNGEEVTDTKTITVEKGEDITFTVEPETGYEIDSVKVCGQTLTADPTTGEYTFEATENATVEITLKKIEYTVTVEKQGYVEDHAGVTVDYAEKASPAEDYTFTVTNSATDITNFSVKAYDANNTEISMTGGANGSYTIPKASITGDIKIVISGDKKDDGSEPVEHKITANIYVNGATESTKSYELTATANTVDVTGYKVLSVKNGTEPFTQYSFSKDGNTLTINANAFTENFAIDIELGKIYTVTLPGADTPDDPSDDTVTGDKQANYGTDYIFTVNGDYVVTVKIGEGENAQDITDQVTKDANGNYVIPGTSITGDIVISVTPIQYVASVNAYEYVKVENEDPTVARTIWLVVAEPIEDFDKINNSLGYGVDNKMFWSNTYNGFAWLVITDGNGTEDDVKAAAEAAIVKIVDKAVTIVYDGDVNMTGTRDINDAQLVYDLYNAHYNNFDLVIMEKMLRADMSTAEISAHKLDVNDAVAVVTEVRK